MAVILSCRNLTFRFGRKTILHDISFDVEEGIFCAVLGRNGSGKTTLLRCLNRIFKPASGCTTLLGKDLAACSRNEIARKISLVPQEHNEIFPYSVMDVVVMGRAPFLHAAARPGEQDYEKADNALAALNARYLAPKNFNRISGGERQIALLARALCQASHIMLLDEPTNHLDFNNQYHLLASIKQLCRAGGISIVASMHDPNLAAVFADEVVMIKNGRIMCKGKTGRVMTAETISELYDTKARRVKVNAGHSLFFPSHILSSSPE